MHTRLGSPRMSVIVPTKDKTRNLEMLPPDMPDVHKVILVDAGPRDGTVDVARQHLSNPQVINQTRIGKGNALVRGIQAATGDIVVTFDTDGSADPCEIPAFVDAFVKGADFMKGLQYMTSGGPVDLIRLRSAGDRDPNVLSGLSLGTRFTDLYCDYNTFWENIVPALRLPDPDLPQPAGGNHLWGDNFETEILITVRVAQTGLAVIEVPNFKLNWIHGESSLRILADGQWVLRTIVTEMARHGRAEHTRLVAAPACHHLPICRLRSCEWEHLSV